MGYYAKKIKHEGGGVADIYNTISSFLVVLVLVILFYVIFIAKSKAAAVARQIGDRVQQASEVGEIIANEIKPEAQGAEAIKQAISPFSDAQLPPEGFDEDNPTEGNTSFLVAAYRPLDDLKKDVVNFFRKEKGD